MTDAISALEHKPIDFVREVSPQAISFYVDELSGIYLPEDFRQEHPDVYDVKYWSSEDRLRGKFGRFAVKHAQEEEGQSELDDILVMGTTIGLSCFDLYGRNLKSLRHFNLDNAIRDVLKKRDLNDAPINVDRADYGSTSIVLGDSGSAEAIKVSGTSYDFGRARTEGRQQTCELFERLLGDSMRVINVDPEPDDRERIVTDC